LPAVEIHHKLPPDQRACPACGGELTEMTGQTEDSERITSVKLTYQVEHHRRQKYRCACNGAVVTAPGPVQVIAGGRYAPDVSFLPIVRHTLPGIGGQAFSPDRGPAVFGS
jgi:transposase